MRVLSALVVLLAVLQAGCGDASAPTGTQNATSTSPASQSGAAQDGLVMSRESARQQSNIARDASPTTVLQQNFADTEVVVDEVPSEAELAMPGVNVTGGVAAPSPAAPPAGIPPLADATEPAPPAIPTAEESDFNTEAYERINENPFLAAMQNPLSTFSIDVDTASYANVRRFLTHQQLPPADAVRIEELVNYFPYDYAPPTEDVPFAVHTEIAGCPWHADHRLVRVGLKGKVIASEDRKASNLVFLLDVSGSMNEPNKLPLVQSAMKLLVDQLGENDRVAIAVYAGAAGLVLPSTGGYQKQQILAALNQLQAGGSTNGGEGIHLAYATAVGNFIQGGINRVILCTDGDFNIGTTSEGELTRLIEEKAKSGVFLSVLGFGDGNYQDARMEALADMGNGNYAYIDTINEGKKVLVEQMSGTLITIAKDVKIQIDFNPAQVGAYRLIGYENRLLRAEDFTDDTKDAGEIGAGHTVTALYEIVPAGISLETVGLPASKYQRSELTEAAAGEELLTLKLRYKQPDGNESTPLEFPITDSGNAYGAATPDFKFAAAVAGFGMLLRESQHAGSSTWDGVLELAQEGVGEDPFGYRNEFVVLVRQAKALKQ